ncbi:helix-turn-helix transcriptional regulator [Treponema sp.]|uniref:helix-turn-helix domain-containing protein n=1 Tax=Treponema sp. TaxID=166 RepID=UPI0025DE6370|nr:helix-turn-helix transcriptional regulator [Treponema sp.]
MMTFADRLREEIEFQGLTRKELAYRADIKQRALDMYLGTQASMPPADVAVRMAKVLDVSVEYLVTGEERPQKEFHSKEKYKKIEKDFEKISRPVLESIGEMIHKIAEREKELTTAVS